MDKVKQFLESNNYYNLYENPDLFEQYIQNLTADDVMHIVVSLNKMLRNKENEEVLSDAMIVGDLTAPTSDIRNDIIQNLLDTIKEIKDNKLRAELVYYTFVDLHMFSDGNGRTSRLLYGLLNGEIESEEWYIHSDDSTHNGDFISYKEMLDERDLNYSLNRMLSQVAEPYMRKYPTLLNKNMFKTYSTGMHATTFQPNDIISEEVLKQLTTEEQTKIGIVLEDNEGDYSIGGLTMLIVTDENGQLNEWIKRNSNNIEKFLQNEPGDDYSWIRNRLSFNLIKDKDLLLEWKLEDWEKAIQIGNKLKLEQFKNMNEIYLQEYKNRQLQEASLNVNLGHKRV